VSGQFCTDKLKLVAARRYVLSWE